MWCPSFLSGPRKEEKGEPRFMVRAKTIEEEDGYDYVGERHLAKPCGLFASVMHLVKGALGAGILSGHAAFMRAGAGVALPVTFLLGAYMAFSLYLLLYSTRRLCSRTKIPILTYPDVGEASCAVFPNAKVRKLAKLFRYTIDGAIMMDLFGACCVYQIIISKTAKQLVEDLQEVQLEANGPSPHIRIYLLCFLLPIVIICLIPHLKWLAPFSFVANLLILFCVLVTVYYSTIENPTFANVIWVKSFSGVLQMVGMVIFTISCACQSIPIENNMGNPSKFPLALGVGMLGIVTLVSTISFFGYVAYLEKCQSPITMNFPMSILPKIIKVSIAIMVMMTHGLNFWVPFNSGWYYMKRVHKKSKHIMRWELFYRALCVIIICIIAIVFPQIEAIMGFLGCICLSNIAFVWPALVYILVSWDRPGLGICKWRLILGIILLVLGLFILVVGGSINITTLIKVFMEVHM